MLTTTGFPLYATLNPCEKHCMKLPIDIRNIISPYAHSPLCRRNRRKKFFLVIMATVDVSNNGITRSFLCTQKRKNSGDNKYSRKPILFAQKILHAILLSFSGFHSVLNGVSLSFVSPIPFPFNS